MLRIIGCENYGYLVYCKDCKLKDSFKECLDIRLLFGSRCITTDVD